ncbi:diacylglycerol kinase eta isoform X2 [Nematostella vectensis]|uniref:diacylglycerol kinase eta isoform X2 n=1 Tax=Nematostella vectensis TaxID=45351 RepID=UPI0020779495|nr:diacylglycerol kinase eta isoform X2 [Nematostella vectensis]
MELELCIKEGHLMKQTGSFQRWKRRYFKLREGSKLFYAKRNDDTIFNEIDLQDVSVAECSIRNVNNSFTVITPFRSLVLCADSRQEMEEWLGCLKSSNKKRSSQSDLLDQISGLHNWYSCAHARPTFCNVCKDILSGVTSKGLSCEVCRFKSHKRCAAKAPNNCKWTTMQAIRKDNEDCDNSDPMSMPHQWLEGNLTPGARCTVCERPCGSKRRLLDFRCLWCNMTVHHSCKLSVVSKCTLGENSLSVLPPMFIKGLSELAKGEVVKPRNSPLLVFVNSKSGDNQGVKFIRKFKQLLNPLQVFDLGVGGPTNGLKFFRRFRRFRILVCGGDGSVGWVMKEVDLMKMATQCQIGVLPLGTGNDLSRVLGWGTSFADENSVPQFLQHLERAKPLMLDRWAIMVQECNPTLPSSRSSSIEALDTPLYQQEMDSMDTFESNVATHLTRILHSSQHTIVISSAKVLCETVKDFVAKVGAASATTEPDAADSLASKCSVLNDKLNLLLKALSIESEASSTPVKEDLADMKSGSSGSINSIGSGGKAQKVFVPRDALMSRANSLKKALKQIIDHTEIAVDEQNAQTCSSTSSLAEAIVTVAASVATNVATTSSSTTLEAVQENSLDHEIERDNEGVLLRKPETTVDNKSPDADNKSLELDTSSFSSSPAPRADIRFLSKGSSHPFQFEPPIDEKLAKMGNSRPTVQFSTCIISKAFLKDRPREGLMGSMISKALLANADALCAAATPVMNAVSDVDGFSEKCVMNNYFGIGIDAKITLDFHTRREEHPEKYRSRTRNMIWYGVLGGKEIVQRTYKNIDQRVKVECDGHRISLPSLQGIVVLNITSYMGGANFWGGGRDDGFTDPSFDDNILEVIAVLGAKQMGMSKVFGGMQHHRIAQCRVVKITIMNEPVPVQVDGEAWMQPPGYIKIIHKNRAQMLVRDRAFESSLKLWTEIQQERNALTTDEEMEILRLLSVAMMRLIRTVKGTCEDNPNSDLYEWATASAHSIEKIFPEGRAVENINRTRSLDFLSNARSITHEVIWLLNEKVCQPPLTEEQEFRIASALASVEPEMLRAVETFGMEDFGDDEREKSQSSKSKSRFSFSRLKSKKPEITKAVTAPAGRIIQFWAVEEVCRWLGNQGLGEYCELFTKHDIRGPELLSLTRNDLKDLGVTKVGHIKRILSGVKQLCGGLSPKSAAKIERTARCEEKTSKTQYIDKEYSH